MMLLVLAACFLMSSATVSASDAGVLDTDPFSLENMRLGLGLPTTLAGFEDATKYNRHVEDVRAYERHNKYLGQFRIMLSDEVILYRSTSENAWTQAASIGLGNSIDWNDKEVLRAIERNVVEVMIAEAERSIPARA